MAKTIEIQVAQSKMVTKEVTLPYCTKSESGNYYDKITIGGKSIRIEPKDNTIKVFNFNCVNDIEISEEEFDVKLNEVIDNIRNFNHGKKD